MSHTTAIASGPISFFTSQGHRLVIPVSMIGFNDGNVEIVGGNPTYNKPEIISWLEHLHELGVLREGDAPAAQAAFAMAAADPGAWGNDVQVTITYPAPDSFDIAVKVKNIYSSLQPSTIASVVGTSATTGASSGLVCATVTTPVPAVGSIALSGGDATHAAAGTLVTGLLLTARRIGSSGNKITASIPDIDVPSGSFTLQVVWQDTLTGQDVSTPAAAATAGAAVAARFAHVLSVSAPPGGVYGRPGAGAYALSGGLDRTIASGVVFTKP